MNEDVFGDLVASYIKKLSILVNWKLYHDVYNSVYNYD